MFSEVLINVAALYDRTFTYKGSAEVGSLVKVPFGNRQAVGLVLNTLANTDQNDMEMKDIVGHLYDGEPILNLELLAIAREMAQFYLCPFGSAIEVMLPIPFSAKEVAGWKKGRTRDTGIGLADALVMKTPSVLTPDQVEAISEITRAIDTKKTIPFLLHGVTGSGKTEVYLRAISHVLSNYPDRQIIYLVPEIALTPSAIATLISRFGDSVGVLHSALSPGERMRTWRRIMAGDTRIIVGARSALFAPVGKLALIIIDEEHETSYRHEGGFYFHTRILAQLRAKKCGALVILGSATPSIEVYYNAIQGRARLLELRSRPAGSMLPDVSIVDMRSEIRSGNTGLLSRELQDAIQQCMNRGEQALLLFNRRGYAQFSLCQTCGYIPQCPLCDVSLHFHAETFSLKCHYCNYSTRYVRECSKCGGERMKNKGAGTEKLEEVLRSTFPDSKVTRIDADTTRFKGSHTRLLLEFSGSKGHILL
ncbi:MAG: primosomal protein N', partial [bacterium]|nr:primosomal protein N' [bacterium]